MQASPTLQPESQPETLKDLLALIVDRAIHLIAPALVDTPRNAGSLYDRLVTILTLAIQLIHRLPHLAACLARRNRPRDADRPDRRDPADGPERPEDFGFTRPVDIPTLVARVCRELLAIAKLIAPEAQAELIALATRAKQAAQPWQRPETPQESSQESSWPGSSRPSTPARKHDTKTPKDDPDNTENPTPKPHPDPLIRDQGSG